MRHIVPLTLLLIVLAIGDIAAKGDSYRLNIVPSVTLGEQGYEVQIEGLAEGSPTFPEDSIFSLNIRRRELLVKWESKELAEAEGRENVRSVKVQIKKGRFILVDRLDASGRYKVEALFDPQQQQYKNVETAMGGEFKRYAFSSDLFVEDISDATAEAHVPEYVGLNETIDDVKAIVTDFENAAIAGKDLIQRQEDFFTRVNAQRGLLEETAKKVSCTAIPNILTMFLSDFQSFLVMTAGRVRAGQPAFKVVEKKDKKKDDKEKGRDQKETGDTQREMRTSYGSPLTCLQLKIDLDDLKEVLAREELLMSLSILAYCHRELGNIDPKRADKEGLSFEKVEGCVDSFIERHKAVMADKVLAKNCTNALKAKVKEYEKLLDDFKKYVAAVKRSPRDKKTAEMGGGLLKSIDETRATVMAGAPPLEVKEEDEKKEKKEKK